MRFNVVCSELKLAMDAAAQAVDVRSRIDILRCVKVSLCEDHVAVTGTDLVRWCRSTCPAQVFADDCDLFIPFEPLSRALKQIPNGTVIDFQIKDNFVTLTAGHRSTKIGLDFAEFGEVTLPDESPVTIKTNHTTLNSLISSTRHCLNIKDASASPFRGVVRLELTGSKMQALTCDGSRAAWSSATVEGDAEQVWSWHSKNAESLLRACSGSNEVEINIWPSKTQVKIGFHTEFRFGNYEGSYPIQSQLLPEGNDAKVTLNTKDALEAVTWALQGQSNTIVLAQHIEGYIIGSMDDGATQSLLRCERGSFGDVALNGRFLADALKSISHPTFDLSFDASRKGFRIDAVNSPSQIIMETRTNEHEVSRVRDAYRKAA